VNVPRHPAGDEEDPAILDTAKAKDHWKEDSRWNGNNHISKATGSHWEPETLYPSAKGRYWVEHTSDYQGSLPYAPLLTKEEAALWPLNDGHDLPEDLKEYENKVSE
jgi:hypothetical protein